MANFRSDNESPTAAPILQALIDCNRGSAHAYGDDPWSAQLDQVFSELFATPVKVLPLATGTAGNSIALAELCPPWGSVICYHKAHIYSDECGAPEFYNPGTKLVALAGAAGKLTPEAVAGYLAHSGAHGVHEVAPSALSLTQSSEAGTVYQPEEIEQIVQIARAHEAPSATVPGHRIGIHMDGARFANAVAALDCQPADISWRAGVDMLSFGASKNGALAAEAVILFGDDAQREQHWPGLERRRKRAGHLFSKMRYVSAQLLAYVKDDLWLQLARHANQQAARFAAAVEAHPEAQLAFPVQANEVFLSYPETRLKAMQARGLEFHLWPGVKDLARLVFSHSTTDEEVDLLIAALEA